VQGKTGFVTDLLPLLQEFYGDRLAMLLQHQAGARLIGQYDINNTYQYIVNREEVQLSWIGKAIAELGGTLPVLSEPSRTASEKGEAAVRQILGEDARDAQAFVDRWKPRVEAMQNARHAKMLRLVLGEVLEGKRFFEQGLAGRHDLLGRRAAWLEPAAGDVLPTRWIE
jgi:hypothetical protein